MRPTEVQQVLRKLTAAYRVDLAADSALVYAEVLAGFDVDVALFAIGHLIKTEQRFPSVSIVAGACAGHRRRLDARRSLPEPRAANWKEVGKVGVAGARAALAAAHARPDDHRAAS